MNAVVEAATGGGQAELPAAAKNLAHEVTLFGTYEQARSAIAAWLAAGADILELALPPGGRPPEQLAEIFDVVAGATRADAAA